MYISFTPILLMVVYFSTEQGLCSCTAFMLETMDLYADLLFIILFNLCKGQGSETGVCFRSDVGIVLCCRNYKLENNTCVHFNTSSTNYIELTDIENSSGNGSISGLFNLTVETWIILSSAGGLVIIISVVGVACLLCRKIKGKKSWEPTTSTYNGESLLNDHPSPNTSETCIRSSTAGQPESEYNSSIEAFHCDPSANYAAIPGDKLSDTYVEENDVNLDHFTSNRKQFSSFRSTKKSLNTFTADIDDKYTMVNLAHKNSGTDSVTNNDVSFSANVITEDHAYFVLESTSSIRDKHYNGPTRVDDLPPPRFSVLGEW
uniref:Uncharacterized protein LOC111136957 isoform X2 n=1 Tax=Crassostrea virginica TaxID=6565 RepID=A0A8B8EVA8_CRAVI|nr:uncharacterized protein LOC111136957 isoform X2 [Crassostrea virginica]